MPTGDNTLMRIGELARRTGMAEATLRAWERRYGIPRPQRTVGGHRLYSDQDVVRLSRVQRLVDQGWAVGAAARRVGRELAPQSPVAVVSHRPPDHTDALVGRLMLAVAHFDAPAAHAALDEALRQQPVTTVLDAIVLPTAERLASGTEPTARAQACFGFSVLRGRLASLLNDMTAAAGDAAVACAVAGDDDEVLLLATSIPLAEAGWVVRLLGTDVATDVAVAAVETTGATLLLATAQRQRDAEGFLRGLGALPDTLIAVGGKGFREINGELPGGVVLLDEPLEAVAQLVRGRRSVLLS